MEQPNQAKSARKTVETAGEVFSDGGILELVQSDADSESLRLLFWKGKKEQVAALIQHDDQTYVARATDVLRALRIPKGSAPYKSTAALFSAIIKTVGQFLDLSHESATLLACFIFSTWFPDSLEFLPLLCIVGPRNEALTALRLLHCFCRHSLYLGDLSTTGFYSLPMYLYPTLIIQQPALNPSTVRLLGSTTTRNSYVIRGGEVRDMFCAKVLYLGPDANRTSVWEGSIQISLPPARKDFPVLDRRTEGEIADEFQPQMLRYRLNNFARVNATKFDVAGFTSETRNIIRTLGACLVDDGELRSEMVSLFRSRDKEIRVELSLNLTSVTIESLLIRCHGEGESVYVGGLTADINAILMGRGEFVETEPREVGAKLKSLHLFTERLSSQGRGIYLREETRKQIHELARVYGVSSLDNGSRTCKFCAADAQT